MSQYKYIIYKDKKLRKKQHLKYPGKRARTKVIYAWRPEHIYKSDKIVKAGIKGERSVLSDSEGQCGVRL